jgi:hypothetical protein
MRNIYNKYINENITDKDLYKIKDYTINRNKKEFIIGKICNDYNEEKDYSNNEHYINVYEGL